MRSLPPAAPATYRTAAFAALTGVTSRTLHHYDRLGLLKPKRSSSGYRLYSERDLQTLEEIVALKFIGVPLKEIAAIRRRSNESFADILAAQRAALEAKRNTLSRAIAAVVAAQASLRSGAAIDAQRFRDIIEVMHMHTNHEEPIAKYTAMLKSKMSHIAGMPAEQRGALQQQLFALIEEVKAALDEPPASPKAQNLLDRWMALLQAVTGTEMTKVMSHNPASATFHATPELRDELWARRAEWLPTSVRDERREPASAEETLAQVRERINSFADSRVMEFIKRARAARVG